MPAETHPTGVPGGDGAALVAAGAAAEMPSVAFAWSAFGTTPGVAGAAAFVERRESFGPRGGETLGGVRLFGSLVPRLTLFGEVRPSEEGPERRFAPSVGLTLRLLGSRDEGAALALMGRYKAEGFADLGGEVELGILASWQRGRLHLDGNVVTGRAFEEDEGDGELLGAAGVDLVSGLRAGLEGRVRRRLAGDVSLPGGRAWDGVAGAVLQGYGHSWIGAVLVGPSNVGTTQNLGWLAMASIGAVSR
jgi:hypothetical protein